MRATLHTEKRDNLCVRRFDRLNDREGSLSLSKGPTTKIWAYV